MSTTMPKHVEWIEILLNSIVKNIKIPNKSSKFTHIRPV